jgi:hypothetical protein
LVVVMLGGEEMSRLMRTAVSERTMTLSCRFAGSSLSGGDGAGGELLADGPEPGSDGGVVADLLGYPFFGA